MPEIEGFIGICSMSDLKENTGCRFFIDDIEIAVFLVDGNVYALDNVCPHQHAAIIYDGFIEDESVICPAHGWKFDLKNGKLGGCRNGLTSFPVKIQDGQVYVKPLKKELKW